MVMKTHFFLTSTVVVLGVSLFSTSYAANTSEYLHLIRHRDSSGNLLVAPAQHQAKPSVMKKTVMPAQPKTFERRSTDWGMSLQEVKENEPVQPSWELMSPVLANSEQRVGYHTKIEDIPAALTYSFYENHLGQAKYVFEPEHEDAAEFVGDFHAVKDWITQSYGSPTHVEEIWLDDLYQYDESLWGQAVLRGHLVMVAEWEKPGTDIVLVLDGGDDTVGLVADFASTTVVRPVVYDISSQEDNIDEAVMMEEGTMEEGTMEEGTMEEGTMEEGTMEEGTMEEVVPSEPMPKSVVEDAAAVPNMASEHELTDTHTEPSLDSPVYEDEIRELEEIESMLMETSEGPSVEDSLHDPVPSVDSEEHSQAPAM